MRSSPCVDITTGLVWFGSHDHHVYTVNIEVRRIYSIMLDFMICLSVSVVFMYFSTQHKQVVHKVLIDGGIVMSSPLIDNELRQLYIATLAGSIVAINCVR